MLSLQITDVKGVIIWGNHSVTQFPDVRHAHVTKGGKTMDAYTAVNDEAWLHGAFMSVGFAFASFLYFSLFWKREYALTAGTIVKP